MEKTQITFNFTFVCKCGETDNFITEEYEKEPCINLLCTQCERKYKVGLYSEELK